MVNWHQSLGLCPLSLLLLLHTATTSAASLSTCKTYQTSGPTGTSSFNNYVFYDWRNLQEFESGQPVYTENLHFNNPVFGLSTSEFFNNTPWIDHWSTAANTVMNNISMSQYVPMVYTPLSVGIQKDTTSPTDDTMLQLTTVRLDDYSATAQINTNQRYMHASIRMSARIVGPPGACAAFFLFGDDNNESDIEILTNDTVPALHATNHPAQDQWGNPIPGATSKVAIPKNGTTSAKGAANSTYDTWNEYRIDWLPTRTDWFVNGDVVCSKTMNIPKIPAWVGLNMWSNGGTWTSNMTVNSTASLQVRWIEIVYNTTNDSPSTSCTGATVRDNNNGFNGFPSITGAAGSLTPSVGNVLFTMTAIWLGYLFSIF